MRNFCVSLFIFARLLDEKQKLAKITKVLGITQDDLIDTDERTRSLPK